MAAYGEPRSHNQGFSLPTPTRWPRLSIRGPKKPRREWDPGGRSVERLVTAALCQVLRPTTSWVPPISFQSTVGIGGLLKLKIDSRSRVQRGERDPGGRRVELSVTATFHQLRVPRPPGSHRSRRFSGREFRARRTRPWETLVWYIAATTGQSGAFAMLPAP